MEHNHQTGLQVVQETVEGWEQIVLAGAVLALHHTATGTQAWVTNDGTVGGLRESMDRDDIPRAVRIHLLRAYFSAKFKAIVPGLFDAAVAPLETDETLRCKRCRWPLAATPEHGCVPGNCAYRCGRECSKARGHANNKEATHDHTVPADGGIPVRSSS